MNKTEIIKKNLEILKKAKKTCICDARDGPHYHELVLEDDESGNEYIAETEEEHQAFIKKLTKRLDNAKNSS